MSFQKLSYVKYRVRGPGIVLISTMKQSTHSGHADSGPLNEYQYHYEPDITIEEFLSSNPVRFDLPLTMLANS